MLQHLLNPINLHKLDKYMPKDRDSIFETNNIKK